MDFFYNFDDVTVSDALSHQQIIDNCKQYCLETDASKNLDYLKNKSFAQEIGMHIAENFHYMSEQ